MKTATSKPVGTYSVKPKRRSLVRNIIKQRSLIFMSLPIFIYVFIFNYIPLFGLTMAFQRFKPAKTFFEQEWIGLD
ncbi:MAG TPA: sugar ABC transporter permease, partial [Bacillota bacterium]|nr:sugar ABC transporter permease [Bacillota bacterium]